MNYQLYYRVPWPDCQKYDEKDIRNEHTITGIQETFVEKDWADELKNAVMQSKKTNSRKSSLSTNETVFVVLKDEKWQGESWNAVLGVFRHAKDAYACVKIERDKLYEDWKDEVIDQDDEHGFCAFRDGEYDDHHCLIYIEDSYLIS